MDVRIVGQRLSRADVVHMLDTMIEVFEQLLTDPARLARFVRLAKLAAVAQSKLPTQLS